MYYTTTHALHYYYTATCRYYTAAHVKISCIWHSYIYTLLTDLTHIHTSHIHANNSHINTQDKKSCESDASDYKALGQVLSEKDTMG